LQIKCLFSRLASDKGDTDGIEDDLISDFDNAQAEEILRDTESAIKKQKRKKKAK
jgi:nitrogen fixation-related uncharacterized protein